MSQWMYHTLRETTPNGHNWHEVCKQGRTRKAGTVTEGILHQCYKLRNMYNTMYAG